MALIDKLNAIGEAIRAKTGKSEKLTLDEMPIEIASLPDASGGEDTMVGAWIFNEVLDITLDGDYPIKMTMEAWGETYEIVGIQFSGGQSQYMALYTDIENSNSFDAYEQGEWYCPRRFDITEEPTNSELIAWIKANARKLGYDEGYEKGYEEGYDQGYDEGYDEGFASGGDDTMVGIWVFNEVLELYHFDFYFDFVATNVADSPQFYNLYSMGDGTLYYFDVDDYDYAGYINGAWKYPEWRTITITEEPTDAECIAWIKANARKATYEDGFAEGEKAILSTFVDWTVSAASNSCIVDFFNDSDYYAHINVVIEESVSGEYYSEKFVLAPQDSYSISTEEMGWQVQGAEWYANVTITKFSKDGEE